jgi:hypothetical protein
VFPFSELHPNAGSQLRAKILLLPPSLRNFYLDAIVAYHRDNGANLIAENGGVQVEELIEEEDVEHDVISKSTEAAMDHRVAADLAESISDHAPTTKGASALTPKSVSRVLGVASALDTRPLPGAESATASESGSKVPGVASTLDTRPLPGAESASASWGRISIPGTESSTTPQVGGNSDWVRRL